jgi:DNA processing protein
MEQYWIWLSSVEHIGPKRFYQLLSLYEDARNVWDNAGRGMAFLGEKALSSLMKARTERYLYALFLALETRGITAVTRLSDGYPRRLMDMFDPPPTLYVRGEANLNDERAISIVGSRHASRDGRRAAEEIAEALAREGVAVVSGMARGVDTAAHQGALKACGRTVAVLGCGVDVTYPPENGPLVEKILETGGSVISEYVPGTRPLAQHFPARNRIISALGDGLLLVEAAKGSGAMLTVDFALEQGRDVFAVPGSIYSPLSAEPNRLIAEGAAPALGPWEILEYYRWAQRPGAAAASRRDIPLEPDEAAVVEPLRIEEMSFDELSERTGFDSPKLNSLLTMLELRGIIKQAPGRLYRAET